MKRLKATVQFVLCISNDGCDDLELRKVYQLIEDPVAAKERHLRVIDESGEDYVYPADYFVPVKLPAAAAKALAVSV